MRTKNPQYIKINSQFKERGGYPCGVMVKAMDCGIVIRTPVVLLRSLSGKYP